MYILIIDNDEEGQDKHKVEILSNKSIKALKVIYETDTENLIITHDEEVMKKITEFSCGYNLSNNDKTLLQILLQTSSTYKNIESIYQIVSEEFNISVRMIKLKLMNIKNILGYNYIHPDDFLKNIINKMGFMKKNIKVFSS